MGSTPMQAAAKSTARQVCYRYDENSCAAFTKWLHEMMKKKRAKKQQNDVYRSGHHYPVICLTILPNTLSGL